VVGPPRELSGTGTPCKVTHMNRDDRIDYEPPTVTDLGRLEDITRTNAAMGTEMGGQKS
jgi:hypothetical protein